MFLSRHNQNCNIWTEREDQGYITEISLAKIIYLDYFCQLRLVGHVAGLQLRSINLCWKRRTREKQIWVERDLHSQTLKTENEKKANLSWKSYALRLQRGGTRIWAETGLRSQALKAEEENTNLNWKRVTGLKSWEWRERELEPKEKTKCVAVLFNSNFLI